MDPEPILKCFPPKDLKDSKGALPHSCSNWLHKEGLVWAAAKSAQSDETKQLSLILLQLQTCEDHLNSENSRLHEALKTRNTTRSGASNWD
jgi:hypothetical protein